MVGRDVALVAEKQKRFAPRKIRMIFCEQGIEPARSGAAGESHCKPVALGDGLSSDANELLGGCVKKIGGCGENFNNSNAWHTMLGDHSFALGIAVRLNDRRGQG